MSTPKMEMVKGTLDIMVLKSLSWGSMHGYGVMRWIRKTTDDALQVEEGALYPALHRMEERGWLQAQWGVSENNRRAKFYSLTPAGREQLQVSASRWAVFAESVAKILSATDQPEWTVQT